MNDEEIVQAFNTLFDDIVRSEDFPVVRPLLAHYTSLSSLEKILETNEIWFSNPLLMNDLEEVRFGVLRGASIIRESDQIINACGTSARADIFRDAFDHWSNTFENEHAFDTYVFCLSEHDPTDYDGALSMWRGYGSNGDGAAIVFDTKQIEVVEGSPLIIARVHYGSTEERVEWLNNILQRFLGILKSNPVPDNKLGLAAFMLFERIKLFALFSKHRGFREEREWRIVYAPDRDREQRLAPMFHYSIGSRGAEPKLRFKVAPIQGLTTADLSLEKLTERIILGPKASSPMSLRVVLRMLDRLNQSSLKDRVRASSIPYRQT
jgi:Protein of unknown function (DUF2971)